MSALPSPPTANTSTAVNSETPTMNSMARTPTTTSDLGPCPSCGSHNVAQIRTSRRNVELAVGNGMRMRFRRLYLDRCNDCRHVVLSGKTELGAFGKNYLPAMDEAFA